jgi:hypothetical protein
MLTFPELVLLLLPPCEDPFPLPYSASLSPVFLQLNFQYLEKYVNKRCGDAGGSLLTWTDFQDFICRLEVGL